MTCLPQQPRALRGPACGPAQWTLLLATLTFASLAPATSGHAAIISNGPPPSQNQRPVITGQPPKKAPVGATYIFVPKATDADGDPLRFRAHGLPSWARFDPRTGMLHGVPPAWAKGQKYYVVVVVSDGKSRVPFGPFRIDVVAAAPVTANGSATLQWQPPTQTTANKPLTDLNGYRVLYGRNPSRLDKVLVLRNAGLTTVVIENLTPGRWYFAVTATTRRGRESALSNIVSKEIR